MKLRVRVATQSARLDLPDDEVTLGDLRRRLRQTFLPSLGFSPDADFSVTLNGQDPLTEDESSLESLGIVSGDLIVVVTADIPPPPQEPPPTASRSSDPNPEGSAYERDVAELSSAPSEGTAALGVRARSLPPEPMLCSEATDGQIPHSLEVLYLSSDCTSANDALVVVAHQLMVETGYTAQGAKNKVASMPEGWKSSGGIYKLHYTHLLCGDSTAALVCVPMGRLVIINATLTIVRELQCVKSLKILTESYVTFPPQDSAVASVFRDLQKLSRIFKDQLVYPLLAATRQALDLPDVFGVVVLPPELKLRIFRLLDVPSILSLGASCTGLQADTEDLSLWRFLYTRDFRDHGVRDRKSNWKELYKQKYKQMCSMLRRRYGPYVPGFPPFHPGPCLPEQAIPSFPYPPGIIGGEYDQRPIFPFPRDPLSLLGPGRPRIDPRLPGTLWSPPMSRWGPFL